MIKKLIAAAVVIGAATATMPFYLSGHYAAEALADYTTMLQTSYGEQLEISNIKQQTGLYHSSYDFDMRLKLDSPAMATVKKMLSSDSLHIKISNRLKHGFLNVSLDSSFDGDIKTTLEQLTTELQQRATNQDQPWAALATTADFSFFGDYQIVSNFSLQGFEFDSTDQFGDAIHVSSQPLSLVSTLGHHKLAVNGSIADITVSKPDEVLSLREFSVVALGHLNDNPKSRFSLFDDYDMTLKLGSVNVKGPDQAADVLSQLDLKINGNLGDQRAMFGSVLTVAKAGNPTIPMTQVENVKVDLGFDVGTEAFENYSNAMQKASATPQDAAAVLASFAHILSDNITVTLASAKVETFAGLVDLTADIAFTAVDMAQFQANPALALQSLSYTAQGQVPRDLLMMAGQLPPEYLDDLLAKQMIEEKDEQIWFKLTGESGNFNLNGKPVL